METATNTQAINLVENPPSPLTYEFLREEGLRHIRALGGSIWSDHNVGDPGITILEVLCVAIADISSRISLDVKELIANSKGELYDNIYAPAAILPCYPLTITDFRKLLIDLPEVKNAWIEPTNDSTATIYHNRINQNVSLEGPEEDRVIMKGLYTVFVEEEEGKTRKEAEIAVKDRLSKHRNLCEYFPTIQVSDPQEIAINTTLEIGEVSDVAQLLAEIYAKLDRFISPRVRFYTLQERLDNGKRIDEIMEGPKLQNGFIDTQELERYTKKKELRSSDLIQEIMDVSGVTLVQHIQMHAKNKEGSWQQASWILPLETDQAPKLIDPGQGNNKITLIQGSVTVATIDWDKVKDKYDKLRKALASSSTRTQDFKLGKNRVSELEKYDSIQNSFPIVYGVGKYGLSTSASPLRKAQAKQLKAYLLFFDQLLANYLSQLANVKELFAYEEENALKTYFAQTLFEVVPDIDIVISSTAYEEMLSVWHEDSSEETATARARRNRFLNHLMARFGEKFNEYALLQYTNQQETTQSDPVLKAKYGFLQNYPTLSSQRATPVGLQQRIRIQLGLTDAEKFDMLEHITLRPTETNSRDFFTFARPLYLKPDTNNPQYTICHSPNHGLKAGDVIVVRDSIYYQGIYKVEIEDSDKDNKNKFKVKQPPSFKFPRALDAGQWFKYGTHRDPFSLQLSFVFPTAKNERFSNKAFQTYAQEVIRAETPAHIKVYTHWFNESQMKKLKEEKDKLTVAMLDNPLNLGKVLPRQEPDANLPVKETRDKDIGNVTFTIGDDATTSEIGITYYVRNEKTGEELGLKKGDGKPITITIPSYKISKDTVFDILALNQTSSVGVEIIQVALRYAVVIPGDEAEIIVENSQQGLDYRLVNADDDNIVMSKDPKVGTGQTISLFTKPLKSDTKLRIRTTPRSGISKTYKKDIPVQILRKKPKHKADPIVFSQEAAKIRLEDSQKMVRYALKGSDSQPVEGDGGAITLTTNKLSDKHTFQIKATTLPSMADNEEDHPSVYLDIGPTVEIHPLELSLVPEYPLPVRVGFPGNVKLKSYKNVNYELKSVERSTGRYGKSIGESVAGTGDNITLTTSIGVQKDTNLQVFATIAPLIDRPPDVRNVLSVGSATLYVVYPQSAIVLPQPNRSNTNE